MALASVPGSGLPSDGSFEALEVDEIADLALAARLVLAAVFVISGLSKLVDQPATRVALGAFGLPESLTTPAAAVLPGAELLVAAAVITPATATTGAVGALFLLGLFIVVVAVSLAKGRAPDCHCFGQIHAGPVSWVTLVRNVALAAVALVILVW